MKKRRSLAYAIILTVASLALFFIVTSEKQGACAPVTLTLKDRKVESLADGKLVDLGSLSKGKPFYLVFSTPTCPYCREELLALDSMRPQYPEEKIGIAVVFPSGSSREIIRSVLNDRWKIKTVKGYMDPKNELFEAFRIRGVPFSVLFDAEGKQVTTFEGFPGRGPIEEKFRSVTGK